MNGIIFVDPLGSRYAAKFPVVAPGKLVELFPVKCLSKGITGTVLVEIESIVAQYPGLRVAKSIAAALGFELLERRVLHIACKICRDVILACAQRKLCKSSNG